MSDQTECESGCGNPCSPENPCEECDGYWLRMREEGLWDFAKHEWSNKGWKEMIK